MTRLRKDRPCNRCLNAEVTWWNADDYRLCDHHMREIFREIVDTMRRAPNAPGSEIVQ